MPKRFSLVSSTADQLRELIRQGDWRDRLPPERILCQRLRVSRTTLRKVLGLLQTQGVIQIVHGYGSRIVCRPKWPTRHSHLVGVLCEGPSYELGALHSYLMAELEHQLHLAGYEMRVHRDARLHIQSGTQRIRAYTQQVNAACWVLLDLREHVQRWFEEQSIPALIVGHRFEGVSLPCIGVNYEAVSRHATGKLLGLGYDYLVLLLPDTMRVGVSKCERGFRQACEAHRQGKIIHHVVYHNSGIQEVIRAMDSAFVKPPRSGALLVVGAWWALSALSHLVRSGRRVPEDVAVISTDFDLFLRNSLPQIAAYVVNLENYASRLARMAVQLAETSSLPKRPKWVIPHLRSGSSLHKEEAEN